MARPEDFLAYGFRHVNQQPAGDGWEVKGTVFWGLNPTRVTSQRALTDFLADWDKRGYKIGLLLPIGQEIKRLEYGGVALKSPVDPKDPQKDLQDLDKTYGTPVHFKWVAWGGSGTRQSKPIGLSVVTFSVSMTIAPKPEGPQMIPVFSRHLEGSFAQSFPGLWAIGRGK